MKKDTDYLLKYVSNKCYNQVLNKNSDYLIDSLIDNRVDVDLNIRYLLKLGVKNIDRIVLERLDDLLLPNNEFEEKLKELENKLTKENLINMLDNS